MLSDTEIYADYSRYALTVAGIEPMRFETWAKKRDNPVPFRTWFENEPISQNDEQWEPHIEPRGAPPDEFELEAQQQCNLLELCRQIILSPASLTHSDEFLPVDANPEEL